MSASRVINGIAFSLISIFSSCHVIQSKIQVVTNICAVKKEFWILQLVGKISYFFRCLLFLLPKKWPEDFYSIFGCYWFPKIALCLKITQNVAFEFFNYGIFHQFCPIKVNLSGNTVWPQATGFQNIAKIDHIWHFNEILSTQNVNVDRFARNVKWDFFLRF